MCGENQTQKSAGFSSFFGWGAFRSPGLSSHHADVTWAGAKLQSRESSEMNNEHSADQKWFKIFFRVKGTEWAIRQRVDLEIKKPVKKKVGGIKFEFLMTGNALEVSAEGWDHDYHLLSGRAAGLLRGFFALELGTNVQVEYLNHQDARSAKDGKKIIVASRCFGVSTGPSPSKLHIDAITDDLVMTLDEIWRDRVLLDSYNFFLLGLTYRGRPHPVGTRGVLQQFGLAIDALAYRLRGHAIDDWGSVSWKAILSIVKDNLALSGKKKRLVKIGEARHYAAHYRAKPPENLTGVIEEAIDFLTRAFRRAGLKAAEGSLPPMPPLD